MHYCFTLLLMAETLETTVGRAAKRYTNVTALYQWANEMDIAEAKRTMYSYPNLIEAFGGSCLEQLRAVANATNEMTFMRSTRMSDGKRSRHFAGLAKVGGERFLIDPNSGIPPVDTLKLLGHDSVAFPALPRTEKRHVEMHIAREGDRIEMKKFLAEGTRTHESPPSESFNLAETQEDLPNVLFDVCTPLDQKQLMLDVAVREGTGVEVLRIQTNGMKGLIIRLMGRGMKIPEEHSEFEVHLMNMAMTLGPEPREIVKFIEDGWMLFGLLKAQREQMLRIIMASTNAASPEQAVAHLDIASITKNIRADLGITCDPELIFKGSPLAANELINAIYEKGNLN